MIHTLADIAFILTKEYPGPAADPDVLESIINRWYKKCLRADGYVWSRLEVDDAPINLIASYTTGTVTVTQGSTAVTGDGTNAWTSAMDQRNIRFAGRDEYYTLTFNDSNDLILERGYEGPSATGLSYVIFQRVYKLAPDCQTLPQNAIKCTQVNRYLTEISRTEADTMAASRIVTTEFPWHYIPYMDAADGTMQIEVYPLPQINLGLTYHYKTAKPELTQPDDVIPSWFPWDALLIGCEVSLSKSSTNITSRSVGIWAARQQQVNEQDFAATLAAAISEDINGKPSVQMRMADRLVAHRRSRQYSDQADHWWELRQSNQ